MIQITIAGKIWIQGAPEKLKAELRKHCSIPNPFYYQQLNRIKNPYARLHLSKDIRYWQEDSKRDFFVIGRGCEKILYGALERGSCEYQIDDRRTGAGQKPHYRAGDIVLRDYQHGVCDEILRQNQGFARLDTGFGKTILGLKILHVLQQRTLIIVPKLDLLNQWVHEIKKYYATPCGIIQGGSCRRGTNSDFQDITVATVQSLARRIREGSIKHNEWGCVICDECHLFVPAKWRSVIEFFSAKYRYGLTATDRRTDGQGKALEFIFGPKLCDRRMDRCSPTVFVVPYTGFIGYGEYFEIIEKQSKDPARNQLIHNLIKKELAANRRLLVLTKRVAHAKDLANQMEGEPGVRLLLAKTQGKERAATMDELRRNKDSYRCLIGTYSLLSTGVDIPSLDTLILAGDLKSDVLAEQSAGRVLRLFEGKTDPKIVDVWDMKNGILAKQGKERQKFYAKQGWKIIFN